MKLLLIPGKTFPRMNLDIKRATYRQFIAATYFEHKSEIMCPKFASEQDSLSTEQIRNRQT
jgi:hypothetical protein